MNKSEYFSVIALLSCDLNFIKDSQAYNYIYEYWNILHLLFVQLHCKNYLHLISIFKFKPLVFGR